MAQVSVGQVENLEDLAQGLQRVSQTLEASCHKQIAVTELKCQEAKEEAQTSGNLLERAIGQENAAQQALEEARENLKSAEEALSEAAAALSSCLAQGHDEKGMPPNCSGEESDVAEANDNLAQAEAHLAEAEETMRMAVENRQAMERRIEYAKRACAMAEQSLEHARRECSMRLATALQSVDLATARLTAARQSLEAYMASNPVAQEFQAWLKWAPAQNGPPVTPDVLRDRLTFSAGQQRMFQDYLYERNPAYRRMVDKYRGEWAAARGDVERNMVSRRTRIHLCGEFAEQVARYALAPLGGAVETQGRTYVGDNGRYTRTDLLVTNLRVPVILGRGEGMGAPVGGSMAFELKCGKADYLYSQKDHMMFQAEGHKKANAHCVLCSRDIHDLSPEKEKELREALRAAGSPLVGMLPRKNEIDQACLTFIQQSMGGENP